VRQVEDLARALKVVGLMNTQFAIQNGVVYLLEVNPRASRSVPFVSKATGVPLAKIGAKCMSGISLKKQGYTEQVVPDYYSVKASVFPFNKFPDSDPILGPEMKSTGEVMGTGNTFGEAYAKAQLGQGVELPSRGTVFISVRDRDKPEAVRLGKSLLERGFRLIATDGTAKYLTEQGLPCKRINKVREGRPHIVDLIKNQEVVLIVNSTEGKKAIRESKAIRAAAVHNSVTYYTTIAAGLATVTAIDHIDGTGVNRLQDLHKKLVVQASA